jgi:hypothetical protein
LISKYLTAVAFNSGIAEHIATFIFSTNTNIKIHRLRFLSISCSSTLQSALNPWNTLPFYITVLNMLNSTDGFLKFISHGNACNVLRSSVKTESSLQNDKSLLKLHVKGTTANAFVGFVFRGIIFASLLTTVTKICVCFSRNKRPDSLSIYNPLSKKYVNITFDGLQHL